jgi:hypothetical protein
VPESVEAGGSAENPMVVTEIRLPVGPVQTSEVPQLDHPRLRDTGNGVQLSYEEDLLREYFGEPDEDGVYR